MGTLISLLATLLAHVAVAMLHRAQGCSKAKACYTELALKAKANGMLWIHWMKPNMICTVKVDYDGIEGISIGHL